MTSRQECGVRSFPRARRLGSRAPQARGNDLGPHCESALTAIVVVHLCAAGPGNPVIMFPGLTDHGVFMNLARPVHRRRGLSKVCNGDEFELVR